MSAEELWSHEDGRSRRYWAPPRVYPEDGAVLIYVQRDTTTSRSCAWASARLVRFDLRTQTIPVGADRNDWPQQWSLPAKHSLEAALCEALSQEAGEPT